MDAPSPDDVRAALALLDARRQKIVAGMFGLMIQNANQVGDREWMARQLTEMTVLAGDIEADSADEAIQAVQAYLGEHAEELLRASVLLFQRVGLDLAPRASEGFTFDEAMRIGLDYMPPSPESA